MLWLGGAATLQLLAIRADRSRDALAMHRVASDGEWLANRLFIPASLAVLVLGIALVLDGPWAFDQFWISLGLGGYAASFFAGMLFLGPESGRIAKAIEEHGPAHELVTARIRRILVVSRIELAILFVVVLDMAVKPKVDDAGFWIVAAAGVSAVAALAYRSYTRGPAYAAAPAPGE